MYINKSLLKTKKRMILLFGAKRSGKTLLANTMTTHQTHSCKDFDEYEGLGNLRLVDVHNTKTFTQKLARRLDQSRACLVTCPRDAQDFDTTRDWLAFARRTFPRNPIALVVTKNDLTPCAVDLGEKFGVRFRGETSVIPEAEFESEILNTMTQSSADRLFYTSAVRRSGVRDVENWLFDVTNSETQFFGFGDKQSRQGLLGKKIFRKKRRQEDCVGVNCEKCIVQ
ncbi:MAG: hypothetical protein CL967_05680 [Euryarchaeota archaeon]|nr:hypothetical protein [Euryarchaeota archaeon]|tara:strand:+ start:895 stop:1572 length:678 start_codon:yes stop_codon:yes gene_type:complete